MENRSGENGETNRRLNLYACVSVMAASILSAIYGYEVGVMTGALLFIKEDLQISDLQLQFLVGIFHMCGLPASMAAGRISDYIGRRYTIILASIAFLSGSILTGYSPSYLILMIGNFISGIGAGFTLIVAPLYCAEISPPSHRGSLTSLTEFSINIGILLGYMSTFFFEKLRLNLGWRMMLAVPAAPSIALIFLMLKLGESPRWLIMQGRVGDAKKVLLLVFNTKQEAEQRLAEIKTAVGIEPNNTQEIVQVPKKTRHGGGALKELFCKPTPLVRRIMVAAVGLHVFMHLGGIGVILLYSPRIFEKTGITSKSKLLLCTIGMGVMKLVFSFISIFFMDGVGRRILLLISSGGVTVAILGLGICLTMVEKAVVNLFWAPWFTIVATYIYVGFMSIGIGPVTWIYSSEIFPITLRAQGLAVCVAVNRIVNMAMLTSFISIYKAITMGGCLFALAGVNVLAFWFYFTLPETKGRSLEDMEICVWESFKN
uniref:Major facilitator superfamily (MFS) profile domain-containing protein n=1 Tax=Lotus japonicus TaxID=34305 RepID=I3SLP1_LOTJA|nr:unknown [Lotus japonicus]